MLFIEYLPHHTIQSLFLPNLFLDCWHCSRSQPCFGQHRLPQGWAYSCHVHWDIGQSICKFSVSKNSPFLFNIWSAPNDGTNLWAEAAKAGSHTSSYMSAAFGWGPLTPLVSRPLATFRLSSLCLSTMTLMSSYESYFKTIIMKMLSSSLSYKAAFNFSTCCSWV